MPEPFAIPAIFIFCFLILNDLLLNFAIVSVVIIALAALIQILLDEDFILFIKSGIFFSIFSIGNLSPITPVEAQ